MTLPSRKLPTRPRLRDAALLAAVTWCAVMVTLALTKYPL